MEEWSIDYDLYLVPTGKPNARWQYLMKPRRTYRAMLADRVATRLIERFGIMTKEEAEAMVKLLNASQT